MGSHPKLRKYMMEAPIGPVTWFHVVTLSLMVLQTLLTSSLISSNWKHILRRYKMVSRGTKIAGSLFHPKAMWIADVVHTPLAERGKMTPGYLPLTLPMAEGESP